MTNTICFDFGNTRQKAALFCNNVFISTIYLENVNVEEMQGIVKKYNIHNCMLSSVINHDKAIEIYLQQNTNFHLLTHQSKLNFTIPFGKPETVGADRLALCAATVAQHPKSHCLTIALGSCITYNFINNQHQFLGGSISPGMNMRFAAMHNFTALLPIAEASYNIPLIGYDTKTNLQSGVLLGLASEINGIIELYKNKFNNLKVIVTGGDALFFKHYLQHKIVYDEQLLFKGLFAICNANI
jgi:type III pantothenate kinase